MDTNIINIENIKIPEWDKEIAHKMNDRLFPSTFSRFNQNLINGLFTEKEIHKVIIPQQSKRLYDLINNKYLMEPFYHMDSEKDKWAAKRVYKSISTIYMRLLYMYGNVDHSDFEYVGQILRAAHYYIGLYLQNY